MSRVIRRGTLFVSACCGMAAFGFSLALLGTLFGFAEMRAKLHVDVMGQGEMSSALIAGMLVSTILVGPLIDRFGNKLILAVSSFLVSAAFASIGLANSFAMAIAASILLGFGGGGLNTATNVVVSELYTESRGAMLNILGIFFGGGAVAVPLVAAHFSPQAAIVSAAVFVGALGLWYVMLAFPEPTEGHSFNLRDAARVVFYPGVLLFAFLLFFESANEQVMNTFTSTWLGAAGATAKVATLVLAGYQLSMAVGRIMAARLLRYVAKQNLVLASGIGSLVGALILFFSSSQAGMAAGVILTGLSFAAIFPTVLAIAGDKYQRFAGTVFGVLFAIALVGSVIAPSTVGLIGKTNIHFATIVPVVGALMVVILSYAILHSGHGREPNADDPTRRELLTVQK